MEIIIRGSLKEGKSTVAQQIATHLYQLGMNVEIRDEQMHPDQESKRRDHIIAGEILKGKIAIIEVQNQQFPPHDASVA